MESPRKWRDCCLNVKNKLIEFDQYKKIVFIWQEYYVVSDIHGYYTELKQTLDEKGFFSDTFPRKLIVCGDALDRGSEAKAV